MSAVVTILILIILDPVKWFCVSLKVNIAATTSRYAGRKQSWGGRGKPQVKEGEDTGSQEVGMVAVEEPVTDESTKGKIVGFK